MQKIASIRTTHRIATSAVGRALVAERERGHVSPPIERRGQSRHTSAQYVIAADATNYHFCAEIDAYTRCILGFRLRSFAES